MRHRTASIRTVLLVLHGSIVHHINKLYHCYVETLSLWAPIPFKSGHSNARITAWREIDTSMR